MLQISPNVAPVASDMAVMTVADFISGGGFVPPAPLLGCVSRFCSAFDIVITAGDFVIAGSPFQTLALFPAVARDQAA
jgi:hypothetical protein